MSVLLILCFLVFDVGFLGYNQLIKKKSIANTAFPWKETLLFLLPVLCTYPGFFIHYSENLNYNHNYELATELVAMMWMIYVFRFLNVTQENNKAILIFLSMVGISMIYIWFFGVLEYKGWSPYVDGASARIKVTYGNINYLAGSLIPILPIFFVLGLPRIKRGKKFFQLEFSSYLKKYQHIFYFVVFLLSLHTLFLTQTRAAITSGIVIVLGVFFFLLLRIYCTKKKHYIIFLIVTSFLPIFFVTTSFIFRDKLVEYSRFFEVFYIHTWQGRFVAWTPAIVSFFKDPIFGYGLGSAYALFFQNISPDSRNFWVQRSYNHTHSEWLEFLQEGGIIGYIGFFILWGYVFYNLIKIYFQSKTNTLQQRLILGCFFGMLGFFFHGIFSVSQRMIVTNIPQYALLAISFVLISHYKKLASPTESQFSLITKISSIYKQWYQNWRKLPSIARTQIPVLLIFLIIGFFYIPWASTQYQFVKISKERNSIFKAIKLENLKKKRYDIYLMDDLTRRYLQFRDYKKALKNIQDMKNVMPHYRINGFLEALCYYYLGNIKESYKILQDYVKRDNYYENALSLLQRLSHFLKNKDDFLYILGLLFNEKTADRYRTPLPTYWNFSVDKSQKKNVVWKDSKNEKEELLVNITFSDNYFNQIYNLFNAYHLQRSQNKNSSSFILSSVISLNKEVLSAGFRSKSLEFIPVDEKESTKKIIAQLQKEILQHTPPSGFNNQNWLPLEFTKIIKNNNETRNKIDVFWRGIENVVDLSR